MDVTPAGPQALDANRAVGRNFRLARQLRGWTQEETGQRLAPVLGRVLAKSSVSAIERCAAGPCRRVIDAHEIVAFAVGFDLPVWWFFMPAGDVDEGLLELVWGREDQAGLLAARVAALRDSFTPEVVDELLDQLLGPPSQAHRRMTRALAVEDFLEAEQGNAAEVTALLRGIIARFEVLVDDTRPQPG